MNFSNPQGFLPQWAKWVLGLILILVGLFLTLIAVVMIWQTEAGHLSKGAALREAAKEIMTVDADRIDSRNFGKLVHLNGKLTTAEDLQDTDFQFKTQALMLKRTVHALQWRERGEAKDNGLGYVKEWSDEVIDSSRFQQSGHDNPPELTLKKAEWFSESAKIGKFRLLPEHLQLFTDLPKLPPAMVGNLADVPATLLDKRVTVTDSGFYLGEDPNNPRIGDLNVTWQWLPPGGQYTVIGLQNGNTFASWVASNGVETGVIIQKGIGSAEAWFETQQEFGGYFIWVLRVVSLVLMAAGLRLMMIPVRGIAYFPSRKFGFDGAGQFAIAFFLAAVGCGTVVFIVWLIHRPFFTLGLVAAAMGALWWIKKKRAGSQVLEGN